ncbi:MAG: SRPBCC family protein [Rubrobacteraceae bacterium]
MAQRLEGSIEVNAPVQQVYEYWETLENLPNFMRNVEQVRSIGENRTHWSVKGPMGASVEFDAQTTQNERNEAVAWETEDGDVETSGQVRFRDLGGDRTRVEVQMDWFDPPGGKVGETVSGIVAGPKTILEQDLQNFKDIMENRATPEEIQERANAAQAHTGVVAFLTSSTGLAVLGVVLVLWLLLRGSRRKPRRSRIVFEF